MIHLIHGIRTEGPVSIGRLAPYLPSPVAYPDYGWIEELETRIVNPVIVGALKPYIGASDILVCHSNGCAIAYELLRQGVPAKGAVFINPALDDDIDRPNDVIQWIDVYSNKGDYATEAARIGAAIGLVDPEWGEMGHSGYTGTDPVFHNIYCDQMPNLPKVSGHGDIFLTENLSAWGPYIASRIR